MDVQVALHPIDAEAGPSLGRLNSLHRRRKSASGSGVLMDGSRADAEAAGAPAAAEAGSQSSRSLMHKCDYCTHLHTCLWCDLLSLMHSKAWVQCGDLAALTHTLA